MILQWGHLGLEVAEVKDVKFHTPDFNNLLHPPLVDVSP